MIAYISTFIVGAVFLAAGAIKVLSSKSFIHQIFKYRLLSPQVVLQTAIAFIGLECAWGVALILYAFPQWLVPGSILMLVSLSALTLWSTSTGRTEDCGCYGGILILTPKQSILLNLGYILLLGLAWLYPIADYHTATWQWVLAAITLVIGSILSWRSQDRPLVDLSRLQVGRHWQSRWLQNSPQDLQQGSHFVVFLSKTCPYCKRWVPLLNVMHTQQDLPNVTAIVSLTDEEIAAFKAEYSIRFPVVGMNKLLFSYMVEGVPTAVLLENGAIANKWMGEIPPAFFNRIKQFYEGVVFDSQPKARVFNG